MMENDPGAAGLSSQKQTVESPTVSRSVCSEIQPRSPSTTNAFADALHPPSLLTEEDGDVRLGGRAQELLDGFLKIQFETGCDTSSSASSSRSSTSAHSKDRKGKQTTRSRTSHSYHPYAGVSPSTGITYREEMSLIKRGIPPLILLTSPVDVDSDETSAPSSPRHLNGARRARRCDMFEDEIDPNQLAVFDALAEWGRWQVEAQEAQRGRSIPQHPSSPPLSPLYGSEASEPAALPPDNAGAHNPDVGAAFVEKAQRELFACITDHNFTEDAAPLWNPGPVNEDLEPTRLMADAVAALVEARAGRLPSIPTAPSTRESVSVYFEDEAFRNPWQYILNVLNGVHRPLCAFLQTGTGDIMRLMSEAEASGKLYVGLQYHDNEWWLALGDNQETERLVEFLADSIKDVGLHAATVQRFRKVKWGALPSEIEAEVDKAADEWNRGRLPSWPMQLVTGIASGLLVWVDMSMS
ncbi:hypothetical protein OF83DRAFT_733517 [Amylostereum chailletii]|nr:hypothetical protein OF83DRAFT_733517 [Amylostereum chailletii]